MGIHIDLFLAQTSLQNSTSINRCGQIYVLNKIKMYFEKKPYCCNVEYSYEKRMPETVCLRMVFNRYRSHFMTGSEGDEPPDFQDRPWKFFCGVVLDYHK